MQPMTSVRAVFALLLVAAGPVLGQTNARDSLPSVAERLKQARPVAIAHRGCWEYGPENSLKALEACFALGLDMAEGDLRTTKDGVVVLMHDATLDRTTNRAGTLKDYTYAALQTVRLREGAGGPTASLTDEHIPRFADVLRVAKGHILLMLHVKEPIYDQIYDVVAQAGAQDRVAFLVEAPPGDPDLKRARFIGKAAYIPIVWQCSLVQRSTDCYADDALGRAFTDYAPLRPLAYLPASTAYAFLMKSADAIRQTGARIVSSNDDEVRLRDPDGIWGPLLRMHVSLILSDRAAELMAYLKAKGLR
jgi:glycerophosphoryl diester phosphodiesterase